MAAIEYRVGERAAQAKKLIHDAWSGDLASRLVRDLGGSDMDDFDMVPYQLNQLVQQGLDPVPVLRRINLEWALMNYKTRPEGLNNYVAGQLGYKHPGLEA